MASEDIGGQESEFENGGGDPEQGEWNTADLLYDTEVDHSSHPTDEEQQGKTYEECKR